MLTTYFNNWQVFTFLFTLLLIVSLVMIVQSRWFFTKDIVIRRFGIMELTLPATPKELCNLVKGLYQLPPDDARKSVRAVRGQLWIDFLFMPLAYGSVFVLCWKVAHKFEAGFSSYVFMVLAYAQVLPWLCDILENTYLLRKIHPFIKEPTFSEHNFYLAVGAIKWFVPLVALVGAVSAVAYFWLTGSFSQSSLRYLAIVTIEVFLFVVAARYLVKPVKAPVE